MVTGVAWIVAATVGLAAGGFFFHFPGSYGEPSASVGAAVVGSLFGAVNGVVLGGLAWLALGLTREQGRTAVATMIVIVGGTHAVFDGSSTQLPLAVYGVVAGLVAAGAAAWILRERRTSTLAVIGVAWTVGLVAGGWSGDLLGLPLTETPLGWAQDHTWDGLVAGLVWGTGTALAGLPDALRRTAAPG